MNSILLCSLILLIFLLVRLTFSKNKEFFTFYIADTIKLETGYNYIYICEKYKRDIGKQDPVDVLNSEHFLNCFSKMDIKKITELAIENKYIPKYSLVSIDINNVVTYLDVMKNIKKTVLIDILCNDIMVIKFFSLHDIKMIFSHFAEYKVQIALSFI